MYQCEKPTSKSHLHKYGPDVVMLHAVKCFLKVKLKKESRNIVANYLVMCHPGQRYVLQYVLARDESSLMDANDLGTVRTKPLSQQFSNQFIDDGHHSEGMPVLQSSLIVLLRDQLEHSNNCLVSQSTSSPKLMYHGQTIILKETPVGLTIIPSIRVLSIWVIASRCSALLCQLVLP